MKIMENKYQRLYSILIKFKCVEATMWEDNPELRDFFNQEDPTKDQAFSLKELYDNENYGSSVNRELFQTLSPLKIAISLKQQKHFSVLLDKFIFHFKAMLEVGHAEEILKFETIAVYALIESDKKSPEYMSLLLNEDLIANIYDKNKKIFVNKPTLSAETAPYSENKTMNRGSSNNGIISMKF